MYLSVYREIVRIQLLLVLLLRISIKFIFEEGKITRQRLAGIQTSTVDQHGLFEINRRTYKIFDTSNS